MRSLDLHRTLNHCQGKRDPCLLNDFASFFSTLYTFSKIFAIIFYPIFYKFDPCVVFFWGGRQNGTHVYRFFFLNKIHPLGRNIPVYLTYVKFLPSRPCRGTQTIQISSMQNENFATKLYEKSVGKDHLCERVILAGTLE